jgi:hypothetical protein
MVVSETSVEGALEPIHSKEHVVGADPRAGGVVHISTDLRRTASIMRLDVTAVVAITSRFNRFFRVIVAVPPDEFSNLNLCATRKVGVNIGGRTDDPELLAPRFLGFRDLLDFDLRCMS